ncbi:SAVED domain-containing protein [Oceanobacillus caeni]|uniref:SAVED domain-containing protein n=1 Tax=Oceanobacillus caeni TaxID=405946 RepID=UPI00362D309A
MKKILSLIKSVFKGMFEKRVTMLLLSTGLIIISSGLTQNWWVKPLVSVINSSFNLKIEIPEDSIQYGYLIITVIVGGCLIASAFWFYFKTRDKVKKQSMLQIRHSSIESVSYSNIGKDLSDYNIETYEINQTEELKVIDKHNLQHALREQGKIVQRILNRLEGSDDIELAYLGLAHIPLVLLIGYQIADKSNGLFFEWNQDKLVWENIEDGKGIYPALLIEKNELTQSLGESKEVIIKIGITYPIEDTDLRGLGLESLNSYYLYIDPPHRNAIISKEQLHVYKEKFRRLLDEINQKFPQLNRIHLFYSGQTSLAYRLGSAISSRMDAEIKVYNYVKKSFPKYNWAITLRKIGEPIEIKVIKEDSKEDV